MLYATCHGSYTIRFHLRLDQLSFDARLHVLAASIELPCEFAAFGKPQYPILDEWIIEESLTLPIYSMGLMTIESSDVGVPPCGHAERSYPSIRL